MKPSILFLCAAQCIPVEISHKHVSLLFNEVQRAIDV